jgi:hypothetical protein
MKAERPRTFSIGSRSGRVLSSFERHPIDSSSVQESPGERLGPCSHIGSHRKELKAECEIATAIETPDAT